MISHHTSRREQSILRRGFSLRAPTNAMMVCFMNVKTTLSDINFMQTGNISFKINLKL